MNRSAWITCGCLSLFGIVGLAWLSSDAQTQPRRAPRAANANQATPPNTPRSEARSKAAPTSDDQSGREKQRADEQRFGRANPQDPDGRDTRLHPDAVQEVQGGAREDARERPEQQLDKHDRSDVFHFKNAAKVSSALKDQPDEGVLKGFDFARDPLNAKEPMTTLDEIMEKESANRPKVMQAQRELLEQRYNLEPKLHPEVKMSRGKPIPVGPTARLPQGVSFEELAKMRPSEIREHDIFPYKTLPHPLHVNGGQVFPQVQTRQFPRLLRYDVDFDIPEAFLPEFPPAIFLQNRPELGDVSRGQVVTINNFRELFKEIMTPVQLEGMRLLLTPLPQEEFNATDDRKTEAPSLGVACFDCHVNGHTTAQFHLSPDIRPQERRFRLDTPSLRGVFNQQIHGSKRSLRSIEDFTEFEQRTAYFNGDPIRAMKKGFQEIPRSQVPHMAQAQNMFDFPPAPKLDIEGRLDPELATESELRGEKLFFGKARCATCHPAPFYLDDKMHDLKVERFTRDPGDGPIKTFTLRGIKDTPPYLHDGRALTLEDTVEFFNLVQRLQLTAEEKQDIVAFLRQL